MSKITISVIVYAWCLNKTTINTNKKTNEQFSSHFFLVHPISHKIISIFSAVGAQKTEDTITENGSKIGVLPKKSKRARNHFAERQSRTYH